MLIQAHPSQDNDIEIIDHYTTDEMRLPVVASIKIHDLKLKFVKNVIVVLSKVTGKSLEFMGTVFDNVSDKEPLVRLSIFCYCNLG
jgi:hypothetical protein